MKGEGERWRLDLWDRKSLGGSGRIRVHSVWKPSWSGITSLEKGYDTGSQFCPTRNLLTNLLGVECGLAHDFIAVAGGNGDTVGRAHRILTGIAL